MKFLIWRELEPQYEEARKNEVFSKILLLLIILVIIYLIGSNFYYEYKLLFMSSEDPFYFKESSGKVLLISLIPFWFYFAMAAIQFLFKFSFKLSIKRAIQSGIYGCLFLVFGIIPFNNYIESSIEKRGYSFCSWYTAPSFRAPDIWLKNDELCLQDGSVIISDIADWFERKNQQGIEPSVDELKVFIKETRKSRDDYTNYK
ncbi:hypothetical protein V6248_17370 [Pseudoalteromonas agarivorans]|uniref:hypothetical protein n=1 Tax=Pseudoalteromonas agarivorans TaxID=176102 RepID=UPI00311EBD5D